MFQLKFNLAGGLFSFNQMSVGFSHGLFDGFAVICNRLVKRRDGRTGRVIEICDQRAGLSSSECPAVATSRWLLGYRRGAKAAAGIPVVATTRWL